MRVYSHLQRGFLTLEILIALFVMTSALSSVILVSFGNQSLIAFGGVHARAIEEGQKLVENEVAQSRSDFRLLQNATSSDDTYEKSLVVSRVPSDPYTTKRLTATVSWHSRAAAPESVIFSSLVTDFADASTTDTCDSYLTGDWSSPSIQNYTFATGDLLPSHPPAGHTMSASSTVASVDAYRGTLYVAVSKKAAAGDDSLFVFDASHPSSRPQYLTSINNNSSVIEGVSTIAAAGTYLYAGNTHVSNFKTCKPSANCSQLQIFDISNPAAIKAITNFLIPTSSPAFVTGTSSSQALANTLFYKDDYVYLGLTKTATGPEFNIIDVRDPLNPHWVGGFHIGASINQIYVRNGYAFITDDDKARELIVLDISNPTSPQLASTFDPSGTLGYEVGKSMYRRGDTLFVGMSFAFGFPELYLLNVGHPTSLSSVGPYLTGGTILGMFVRDAILFLLVSSLQQLQMVDVSNVSAPRSYRAPIALPGTGSSIDCEGNYFFISSNAAAASFISIIGPYL